MNAAALFLVLAAPLASAQTVVTKPGFGGFDGGDVCYQWSGGHGSAGAYSKCNPTVQVAVLMPAAPPPAPAPMAVAPVCPPQISVIPEPPKPRILRKPKPKVQC